MPLDPGMDARLRRWAEGSSVGNGSGYSTMSVLHPDWQPPSPGQAPAMKTFSSTDAGETKRALLQMPRSLLFLVLVVYRSRMTIEEQARLLQCQPATVTLRLGRAHAWLRAWLAGEE